MSAPNHPAPPGGRPEALCWLLAALLTAAVFTADLLLPLGVAGGTAYVLVLMLFAWGSRRRWVLHVAALTTVLTVIDWIFTTSITPMWVVTTNRSISIVILWAVAGVLRRLHQVGEQRDRALTERESALMSLRVLTGLLPICMYCKKIRDDERRWTEVESYLREHSEVEFSHGLCESCLSERHSDYAVS